MVVLGFRDLHPDTRRLVLMRASRSIGQGALVVDFALYLHTLHWSSIAIGVVLSIGGMFGAIFALFVGETSDIFRRKPFIIVYEVFSLILGIASMMSSDTLTLEIGAVAGGFGRGANGSAGPFSPAEQAWLAEKVTPEHRGRVYSLNTALGFFGMASGALIAILPSLVKSLLGEAAAYRPLFALVALGAVVNLFLLSRTGEEYRGRKHPSGVQEEQDMDMARHRENVALGKLVLINALYGLSIGLFGPLISYWFALRFHIGPGSIAPVMAATFIITGVMSLLTGGLTEHFGIVRPVVWERLLSAVLLLMIPLMPAYWMAALAYLLRSAFSRGVAGAQQALAVSLVGSRRRGLATSLNAVSFLIPRSAGPGITGYLIHVGMFALPFFLSVAIQGMYLLLYWKAFRNLEPRSMTDCESE